MSYINVIKIISRTFYVAVTRRKNWNSGGKISNRSLIFESFERRVVQIHIKQKRIIAQLRHYKNIQ